MHVTSLAAGRRCPGFASVLICAVAFDVASGGGEPPVEGSGTGVSPAAEATSKATAQIKTEAKPGQRRPAANEVTCTA